MTLKEFTEKYGIDYQVAYSASWKTEPVSERYWNRREYNEDDLLKAVISVQQAKIDRAKDVIARSEEILKKCRKSFFVGAK